jgi:hypothetical protein
MTKDQKRRIYEHWKSGGSLCCEDGLKFLKTVLPEKQAKNFEAWAYAELSCRGEDPEYRRTTQTRKLLEKLAGVWVEP